MRIPRKFENSLSEKPFEHCQMCERELLESNREYLIEKAYRRFPTEDAEELVFEVAICVECATQVRATLSQESLTNIQDFFMEKGEESRRRYEESGLLPEDPLQECLLSGKGVSQMKEYQIYAHCRGRDINLEGGYYLLSDDIMEEIQSLLSKETKDELQRFSDDNFGLPPELRELFSRGDLIAL